MSALKEEAVQMITNIQEEDMIQVVAFLKSFVLHPSGSGKPADKKLEALKNLEQFRGTLPKNFDYKKELEEALDEKYGDFACSDTKAVTPEEFLQKII